MLYNLSKEEIEKIFFDIAKELKKKLKGKKFSYELVIVGGASILLNYSFRMSTVDIDCVDVNDALMNEIIGEIGDKYHLPVGWINTDFLKTNSYTPKLIQYSSFYKSYSNDTLIVRTIKDEYLIAMKAVAARKYKNDYSDIYGIIKENSNLSLEKILNAIKQLYGEKIQIDSNMIDFLNTVFNDKSINYDQIKNNEIKERENIIKVNLKKKQ